MSSRPFHAGPVQPGRAIVWLLTRLTANVEGAVYGTVVIGVLFAAEDAEQVGYPATIGAAMLVLAVYWLTGIYAHDLGDRLQRREPLDLSHVWRSCMHELTIVEGGLIPVAALLVAWAAGADITAGVTAAVWTTAVTIIVLEVAAGWRARPLPKRLWFRASAGVVMGFAIVALKLLLH